tara:strand:- start:35378 stop:35542 length:165 start_codon:yes stop_codon:yes gene_type:complete
MVAKAGEVKSHVMARTNNLFINSPYGEHFDQTQPDLRVQGRLRKIFLDLINSFY